jgi:hypothetical protein
LILFASASLRQIPLFSYKRLCPGFSTVPLGSVVQETSPAQEGL